MNSILILKTAALGDVLRTTAILPGLCARHGSGAITWLTAPAAVDLVRTHPLVARVEVADPRTDPELAGVRRRLAARTWTRVISLDDEHALCALAAALPAESLSGAFLRPDGTRAYTPDVGPWFDMGLLSVHGKAVADRLKIENQKSHPRIHAEMLGIDFGKPRLVLPVSAREFARAFFERAGLGSGPLIGLNTGAGGRWHSKQLSVERTLELALRLHRRLGGQAAFLVLGGASESERNAALVAGLRAAGSLGGSLGGAELRVLDAGCDNALLDFAALIEGCDLLVSSDSLALHMAIALEVPVVAFFAPTSAAEIEFYGRGEAVASTASDACSYRPDADNSTITSERLETAVLRQLAAHERRPRGGSA